MDSPCTRCGACCAFFRVLFYWREAEAHDADFPVPKSSTLDWSPLLRCMKGTDLKHRPQCIELKGRIGVKTACSIYSNRPTPCRAFTASFEDGKRNPRCDEARIRHGLAPLTAKDWILEVERPAKRLKPQINPV